MCTSSFFITANFPPTITGSDTFQIDVNQNSIYVVNVTDPGDTFNVTVMDESGTLPDFTLTKGLQEAEYILNISLTVVNGFTFSIVATDSMGASSNIQPQVRSSSLEFTN